MVLDTQLYLLKDMFQDNDSTVPLIGRLFVNRFPTQIFLNTYGKMHGFHDGVCGAYGVIITVSSGNVKYEVQRATDRVSMSPRPFVAYIQSCVEKYNLCPIEFRYDGEIQHSVMTIVRAKEIVICESVENVKAIEEFWYILFKEHNFPKREIHTGFQEQLRIQSFLQMYEPYDAVQLFWKAYFGFWDYNVPREYPCFLYDSIWGSCVSWSVLYAFIFLRNPSASVSEIRNAFVECKLFELIQMILIFQEILMKYALEFKSTFSDPGFGTLFTEWTKRDKISDFWKNEHMIKLKIYERKIFGKYIEISEHEKIHGTASLKIKTPGDLVAEFKQFRKPVEFVVSNVHLKSSPVPHNYRKMNPRYEISDVTVWGDMDDYRVLEGSSPMKRLRPEQFASLLFDEVADTRFTFLKCRGAFVGLKGKSEMVIFFYEKDSQLFSKIRELGINLKLSINVQDIVDKWNESDKENFRGDLIIHYAVKECILQNVVHPLSRLNFMLMKHVNPTKRPELLSKFKLLVKPGRSLIERGLAMLCC